MATRRELHVGSLITAPQDVIPLYNFLETYRIDGRITEINAVLTRNNLTAETVAGSWE